MTSLQILSQIKNCLHEPFNNELNLHSYIMGSFVSQNKQWPIYVLALTKNCEGLGIFIKNKHEKKKMIAISTQQNDVLHNYLIIKHY